MPWQNLSVFAISWLRRRPADYFDDKLADGWRLVADRMGARRGATPGPPVEDIPFGLRVASDCRRLEENPDEVQVLLLMLEVLVQDGPLSTAAQRINERGYRTRDGEMWTRTALFYLLPRLIEVGPRLSHQRGVGGAQETSI